MLAASAFGGAALGLGLLGMQVFMVFYGISAFFGMPKKERRGRLRFIIISCTILATSSGATLLDAWGSYRVLYRGGPNGKSYIQANIESWGGPQVPMLIGDALGWMTIIQGDALMLWRCYILWRAQRWVMIVPCITCFAATICIFISFLPLAAWNGEYLSPARLQPTVAGISMSVATNIMITSLIVSRLVITWKNRQKAFPEQTGRNIYSNVIAIIVESAAPLALFGICLIIAVALARIYPPRNIVQRGRVTVVADIFNWLYSNAFCGLSPQMIIFRVTTGNSWRNTKDSDDGAATFITLKPMEFSSSPYESQSQP